MDSEIDKMIEECLADESVNGILITDDNGLCLLARGTASSSASGYLASIGRRVKEIGEFHNKENENPSICLQLKNSKVFIKNHRSYTIAMYYNA
ncbi:hypothetical protein K502DRAFT_346074 [Neoconidiobolus thromboides FSU 785]|nr:hypothetical protein K502DRAFT_346074 [Neoconidiobolus thromboides FSU 785]